MAREHEPFADRPAMQMDVSYKPAEVETRQVFGISMEQRRNDAEISASTFTNFVSKNREVRRLCHCHDRLWTD